MAETTSGGTTNTEAQKHFVTGTNLADSKNYNEAIAEFDQAIAGDPKFAKAYANRASARFNLGNYQGAIQDLDFALKYFPNMPALVSLREKASQQLEAASQSQQAAQRRAYGNALLQQAILGGGDFSDPSTMIMMRARGAGMVNSGPIVNPFAKNPLVANQSVSLANPEGSQQDTGTNSASARLSTMTQGMSPDVEPPQNSEANASTSSSRSMPSCPAVSSREYFAHGCELSKAMNYAGAIPEFSKCIEMEPNFGDAYANRGLARFHTHDFAGALQDFQAADRLIPNNQELKRYIDLSKQALNSPSTF
jgi:tetratricopeptide (TPR) repeat protein